MVLLHNLVHTCGKPVLGKGAAGAVFGESRPIGLTVRVPTAYTKGLCAARVFGGTFFLGVYNHHEADVSAA